MIKRRYHCHAVKPRSDGYSETGFVVTKKSFIADPNQVYEEARKYAEEKLSKCEGDTVVIRSFSRI